VKVTSHVVSVTAASRRSFVDLSDDLARAIKDSGVQDGFALVFCEHTTCALVINEWEAGLLSDVVRRIEALVPDDSYYAHDDFSIRTENVDKDERINGSAHVSQIVLGTSSQAIPLVDGEPTFGRWQRLFLLELDEPKPRTVRFHIYA
jgi:secondary thiamine-phosphate synthase enzyme